MDVAECQSIIDAAAAGRVKLMTAYRLHFEQGNLQIIDLVKKGKIGEPKMFSSVFSHQV
jgi:predicted dehydrogenase